MPRPTTMKPQTRTVLEYLRSGKGLSAAVAMMTLGIGSLSSRVAELNALGYDISSASRRTPNGKRYNVYHLVGEPK